MGAIDLEMFLLGKLEKTNEDIGITGLCMDLVFSTSCLERFYLLILQLTSSYNSYLILLSISFM